ncbi:MAG: hypothetical protein NTV79_06245 [Candidatus Aureabacteria bacterium]|nr:hypothetical protein [Candidatus Auribacterota bacterium]
MNRNGFSNRPFLLASVFAVGFTALAAQIVFLRELLVLFYGNELSLGIVLGCWLFWTGAGSFLGGKAADRFRAPERAFALSQLLFSLFLLLTFLAIRSIKLFLAVAPGQIIGYVPILVSSFIVLSPFCLVNGILFSLGCAAQEKSRGGAASLPAADPSRGIGLIYIMEALGAVAGGLLAGFWLIRVVSPTALIFLLRLL